MSRLTEVGRPDSMLLTCGDPLGAVSLNLARGGRSLGGVSFNLARDGDSVGGVLLNLPARAILLMAVPSVGAPARTITAVYGPAARAGVGGLGWAVRLLSGHRIHQIACMSPPAANWSNRSTDSSTRWPLRSPGHPGPQPLRSGRHRPAGCCMLRSTDPSPERQARPPPSCPPGDDHGPRLRLPADDQVSSGGRRHRRSRDLSSVVSQ
jgi:hypothetical protein